MVLNERLDVDGVSFLHMLAKHGFGVFTESDLLPLYRLPVSPKKIPMGRCWGCPQPHFASAEIA